MFFSSAPFSSAYPDLRRLVQPGEALRIFDAERKANPDSDIFEKKTNEQLADWGVVSERMGHSRTRLQSQSSHGHRG
jgi:hypothetical protein